jgi:hypothetical protein
MIDNHPGAYPQSGLKQAAVVFEGLAEFGITRFMATYTADTAVVEIGPIRSTRLYFAQLAMGMHPIYGHAGGSPDGEELVRTTTELVNFDADGSTFAYRDTTRVAPHNLYTSAPLLSSFSGGHPFDAIGLAEVGYLYDAAAPSGSTVGSIRYFFEDASSRAAWAWDAGCGCYRRSQRDEAHVDRITGEQLTAANVVMMEVTGGVRVGDAQQRIDQNVIGSGRALVFRDGVMLEATWRKDSDAAPLRFFDVQTVEISFAPGTIWIAGIPSLDRVTMQ